MVRGRKRLEGAIAAHLKAAILAAAGAKNVNVKKLDPFPDTEPTITLKPSEFFAHVNGRSS